MTEEQSQSAAQTQDTVLVKPTDRKVYHTDDDCHIVTDDYEEWAQDDAEAWDYRECRWCANGQAAGGDGGDKSLYQAVRAIGEGEA